MFTQKRTLLFLTVTVIVSLLLAACQAANSGAPITSSTTDTGKNITIVIAEDPPSFYPIVSDTD
jgi:ABC-type oligopeptide transport system substrate-binding subunit